MRNFAVQNNQKCVAGTVRIEGKRVIGLTATRVYHAFAFFSPTKSKTKYQIMEQRKEITQEMRNKLREPLPKEAVSPNKITGLSSIKSIYVTERLNDVFGINGWNIEVDFQNEYVQTAKNGTQSLMIVCKTRLTIPEYGIDRTCFGGNNNSDVGDAYKGATTDAITKLASYLEIGIDVFKGLPAERDTVPTQEKESVKAMFLSHLSKVNSREGLVAIMKEIKNAQLHADQELQAKCNELGVKYPAQPKTASNVTYVA